MMMVKGSGNHMKRLRLVVELDIPEVMKATGYSRSMIHKIEEGVKIPAPEKANIMRKIYKTDFNGIYEPFYEGVRS